MLVIFHVDKEENWELAIGNIRNMLRYGKEQQEEFHIELLANSKAVKQYVNHTTEKDGLTTAFQELLAEGVDVCACHNALNSLHIQEEDLIEGIRVVPAGVVELAQRQQEGYSYIKP